MKLIGIYCIKNIIDRNIYIGSSIDINKRKKTTFYCTKKQ